MPRSGSKSSTATAWLSTWIQMYEIAFLAPQVMAYRSLRLLTGGWPPSRRDQVEYVRMVTEKINAVGEITAAVLTASPGAGALGASVKPVHRKVVANHRRLSQG